MKKTTSLLLLAVLATLALAASPARAEGTTATPPHPCDEPVKEPAPGE